MASRRRAYVDNHEIYLEGGDLAVDFLGRYEDLETDLAKALRLIGVARRLEVPKSNVTPNKETRQDYRSYYTPRDRGAGARMVRAEIELWNTRSDACGQAVIYSFANHSRHTGESRYPNSNRRVRAC